MSLTGSDIVEGTTDYYALPNQSKVDMTGFLNMIMVQLIKANEEIETAGRISSASKRAFREANRALEAAEVAKIECAAKKRILIMPTDGQKSISSFTYAPVSATFF